MQPVNVQKLTETPARRRLSPCPCSGPPGSRKVDFGPLVTPCPSRTRAVESFVRHARRRIIPVPQSLHRTWAALAIAALAVLVVAVLAGRDFVRHVNAPCPG